jgi:hypothetical protein
MKVYFANHTKENTSFCIVNEAITVNFACESYKRELQLLLSPIKEKLILGTPWKETIIGTNDDWASRVFGFTDKRDNSTHQWFQSTGLAPAHLIELMDCENIHMLEHDTEWTAILQLEGMQLY